MAQQNNPDFPADDEMPVDFPDFNGDGARPNVIPWAEVSLYIYYKVLSIRTVQRRNGGGTAMIICLQRRAGTTFETWATSIIQKDITAKLEAAEKCGKFLFIKSLGKKTSIKSGRDYWNFVFFCK